MATLVSIATGLIGTLVGAAVAWLAGRRQYRLETSFVMYHEFNALEMTRSRNLAGKMVLAHHSDNFDDMRKTLDPEEMRHVWNVLYFYQGLWFAIKSRSIYKEYVPEMFGEHFCWWYTKSYEKQLVEPLENWQSARQIHALKKWMELKAGRGEWENWRKRAAEMIDRI